MKSVKNKLQVIDWLTDYKSNFSCINNKMYVELVHKNKFSKFIFTANDEHKMLNRLNNFMCRKLKLLSTKSVDKPV